jgi:ATP-dependent 26S proteasome regulatory subunit
VAFQAKKISAFVGMYSNWRRLRTFAPRKMESVILPDGVADSILQKLKDFIADRAWYQEMGIPYHLGMLFHGTPGSGKTSIIGALAGELKMNLYILSLAGEDMNDERFACLLSEIPPNSFMVLEDVDAAKAVHKRTTDTGHTAAAGLTLTGILNALDGFMASEGSIVLMTTNHRELLDPALIRPGRVDFEVKFSTATQGQLRRLYQRFFPDSNGDAEIWAMAMEGRTMAEAQQDLLCLKKNPSLIPHGEMVNQ